MINLQRNYKLGGVAIYSREFVKKSICGTFSKFSFERCFEITDITLETSVGKIKFISIYKPPIVYMVQFYDIFEKMMNSLINQKVIIMGDLNINGINNGPDYKTFRDIFDSFCLRELFVDPIRIKVNSYSAIDFMMTNFNVDDCRGYQLNGHFLIT